MKNIQILLVLFFISLAGTVLAQQTCKKVIAVLNRANWCGTCKKYGAETEKLLSQYADIEVIKNDLTNKKTTESSADLLRKSGVLEVVSAYNATGILILIDSKTKKVIKELTIVKMSEELKKNLNQVLATAK